jgi:hypothetical protein
MDPFLIHPTETVSKLTRRLNILRAAGAISDYRIVHSSGRLSVQVRPGDSLMGEELRQFVGDMIEADLMTEQISVVSTFDR